MQNKFRRVSTELRRWEKQLYSDGNHIEKWSYIFKFTHNKFTAAIKSGFIVHDIDLHRFRALQAQEEIGNLNLIFKASHDIKI